MYLMIHEHWSDKIHYRKIKYSGSITYKVEGNYMVIRGYYDGEIKQKIDVSKYGSFTFTTTDSRDYRRY